MKQSKYNILLEIDGIYLLFNTFNCSIAEIEKDIFISLEKDDLTKIAKEDLDELYKNGFLISIDKNEKEEYLKLFEENREQKILSVKLLLATTCNCKCIYCYQNYANYESSLFPKKNVSIFLRWVENMINNDKIKEINIEFFGGEPLLSRNCIPLLLDELKHISLKYKIHISIALITNATLLNRSLIKTLIEHNVEFKITIDGTSEINDARRMFKGNNQGTYITIISALKEIIYFGGIELINVRMNIDKQNLHNVEALAKVLYNLNIRKFYCGRVLFRGKQTAYDINVISTDEFDKSYDWELYKILKKYGYANVPAHFEINTSCQFHNKYGYVVSPNLEVAKCDELLDLPEYRIGYINDEGKLVKTNENYGKQTKTNPSDFEECNDCKLLPICGAGCPIVSLNAKGDLYSSNCKETLDSVRNKIINILKASQVE